MSADSPLPSSFEVNGKVFTLSVTAGPHQMTRIEGGRFSLGKALFEAMFRANQRDDAVRN